MPAGYPRLTRYPDLVAAAGDDPFVRWSVSPQQPVAGWALDTGVAFLRAAPSPALTLTLACAVEEAVTALPRLLTDRAGVDRVTLPRGSAGRLSQVLGLDGDAEWDWMWTADPPPDQPGEAAVRRLVDAQHEIAALLTLASPRHSTAPGSSQVQAWHGVHQEGRLVACAAHAEYVPSVPHLASVATHPEHRGRGWGAAATAAVTRAALRRGAPVVTLGVYADNHAALRLYDRLGLRHGGRWSSRSLTTPGRASPGRASPGRA